MDVVKWRRIFVEELKQRGISDAWSFWVNENFQRQDGWLMYSMDSFAKFVCSFCENHSWSSSKVHIKFCLHRGTGRVKMHISRQKCKYHAEKFENPIFKEHNIEVVISRLVNWMCRKMYGLPRSSPPRDFERDTWEEGPHQKHNC